MQRTQSTKPRSTSRAARRAARARRDDEGMAKKPVNLLATKLVRETLGQISKDSPGPWHTQKGVILHGVVALIHEKAYDRGLEHYRYDEREL